MRDYNIESKYKIMTNKASKGCQEKYFYNHYWYKMDGLCNEGINEHIVSLLLQCSTFCDYVYYERCTVNKRPACRSYNFIKENEMFITLHTIIRSITHCDNTEDIILSIPSIYDRYQYILNAVNVYTHNKLDYEYILQSILYLDLFILNRDRHLNNFGIIANKVTQEYRAAPIFDNGLSLLGGCDGSVYEKGIEQTVMEQTARTISGSFAQQAYYCTNGTYKSPFKINFNQFFRLIAEENISKYIVNILEYQYKNLGKIFSDFEA